MQRCTFANGKLNEIFYRFYESFGNKKLEEELKKQ